jgi:hypothetical protein
VVRRSVRGGMATLMGGNDQGIRVAVSKVIEPVVAKTSGECGLER